MNRWVFLVIVSAVLACGLWLYSQGEWVEETVQRGYRGEARQNSLLAAQRLLNEMGVPATSVDSLGRLPSTDGLIVLLPSRARFGEFRQGKLLEWVESGGSLIVAARTSRLEDPEAESEEDEEAGFFDELEEEETVEDNEVLAEEDWLLDQIRVGLLYTEDLDDPLAEPLVESVSLRGSEREFEIEAGPGLWLDHPSVGAEGGVLVDLEYGAGRVVVLVDGRCLTQPHLGERDHAELLWTLARECESVLLIPNDYPVSFMTLVWRWGWALILSGVVALAFWLWRRAARFGPLFPEPPKARREIMAHIDAMGRFLWDRRLAPVLLDSVRRAFEKRLKQARPSWSTLSEDEIATRLSEEIGESVESIRESMKKQDSVTAQRWVRAVRILETARKAL